MLAYTQKAEDLKSLGFPFQAENLPEFKNAREARRFLWPLVRSKNRQQRKDMANRLVLLWKHFPDDLKTGWTTEGINSPLDRRHRFHHFNPFLRIVALDEGWKLLQSPKMDTFIEAVYAFRKTGTS